MCLYICILACILADSLKNGLIRSQTNHFRGEFIDSFIPVCWPVYTNYGWLLDINMGNYSQMAASAPYFAGKPLNPKKNKRVVIDKQL